MTKNVSDRLLYEYLQPGEGKSRDISQYIATKPINLRTLLKMK